MNYEQQLRMLLESAAKKEKALSNKKIPLKQEKQQDTNESKKASWEKEGDWSKQMKKQEREWAAEKKKKATPKQEKETVESIEPLGELNLKPWKQKSAFSKTGYEKVAQRQSSKMKDAEAKIDSYDEEDDNEGVKSAGKEWKKARNVKSKAETKAKMAKESISTTVPVIAESSDLSNMLKLAGLKPLNG
jgi:hypothetical protein